jgi:hypothetical protein
MFILRGVRHSQNMVLAQLFLADGSAIFHELIDKQKCSQILQNAIFKQMREITFDEHPSE